MLLAAFVCYPRDRGVALSTVPSPNLALLPQTFTQRDLNLLNGVKQPLSLLHHLSRFKCLVSLGVMAFVMLPTCVAITRRAANIVSTVANGKL
jgi:hypothetical protein